MARPKKEGLDYFPLDVDMDQDDKVLIIISKFGFEGFGILIKLMMEIYKNGYSYQWTEKEQIIFSSRVSVDRNKVEEIVNDCIKWGLFNKELYDQYEALTSKGIQERYLLATSRRVNGDIKEELRLVSVDINSNSTKKEPVESTQSKRKEKKVKKDTSVSDLFNHYISKNIVNHQKITSDMRTAVNARLKEYTFEQLIQAIDNYTKVYTSDKYWFDTKYTLADLMRAKDVRKFIDEADPLRNYLKDEYKNQQPTPINKPRKTAAQLRHEEMLKQARG